MKTIVITGTSRGIGLATANKFLAEGWKVIGTFLNTQPPIKSSNFIGIKMDQGSSGSIQNAVKEIGKISKNIDVLVNNAAMILEAKDQVAHIEKIRKVMEVDLFGLIDLTEKLLPSMSKGGHIVSVSSLYGAFSFPIDDTSSTGYRMAKAALNMYSRTLAFRLKDQGIVVSSLDPGWVKTDMGYEAVSNEDEAPDREPEQPASEIYQLVSSITETGQYWRFGKKREW